MAICGLEIGRRSAAVAVGSELGQLEDNARWGVRTMRFRCSDPRSVTQGSGGKILMKLTD